MNINDKVSEYINKAPMHQIEIMETLRQLIHESVPETIEEIKWNMPVFKKKKTFTYFAFFKHHINMGFFNFEKIEDTNNLLQGEGNTMRHIKIKSIDEINAPLIKQWLIATAE